MANHKIRYLTLTTPLLLCGIGGRYYCTEKHEDLSLTLVDSAYVLVERKGHESQGIPLHFVRQFIPIATPQAAAPQVLRKKKRAARPRTRAS